MNIDEDKRLNCCEKFESKIIKDNWGFSYIESNVNFKSVSVSVLPKNAVWEDMEGFVDRKYGPFGYYIRNKNDEIIANLIFYFSYSCKGTFNGKGSYLADATVSPKTISASPGYYLDCNVTASEPKNYGTKENPAPGVTLRLQVKISSYKDLTNYNVCGTSKLENIDEKSMCTSQNEIDCNQSNNLNFIYPHCSYDGLNSIEFFAIATLRGDCQVNLISAECY
ncbi:hypothetical protein C672_2160 [[Clostridium] bifermentans ATCC 638]|uniref:Uncharacterized protein n=1 Tax=Paraclostridium bifermentans ATCC 638 = DSM 14991 TaxID=1233171 RepID=T4VR30_PARBF|nr:hypothetical protein [Paraclostridium bifermentans]EQK43216.1 hypothetical protein C672_2160 [[Clostridium] bifermentans ATCC 638] [Paraclostridium bifermentans ATCC 638 = DSM 14991]RIZ60440.1 hypothetical protein CHH45_01330 [Paraclostridium bifermentans]UAG17082.1 hypothetical protein KXZ80_09825 [Paraclostridium bifermentans]